MKDLGTKMEDYNQANRAAKSAIFRANNNNKNNNNNNKLLMPCV